MLLRTDSQAQLSLMAGVAMLYAAGRWAAEALARGEPAPLRRALGHWLPIAALTLAAVLAKQATMAMALIFAASVAGLSLVGGCIAVMGSAPAEPPAWTPQPRKAASLLLPATVLAFLIGLTGNIGWLGIFILLCQALMIGIVLLDPADRATHPPRLCAKPLRVIVAIFFAAAGAWAAVLGTLSLGINTNLPPPAVLATIALSPLLAAPMLLSGSSLALRGQAWAAHATHIAVAQLNLCVLLPVAAAVWLLRWHTPMDYPIGNWRVDALVLVLLAVSLLPAAAGRWKPAKLEGFAWIALYIGYVLAVIAAMARA